MQLLTAALCLKMNDEGWRAGFLIGYDRRYPLPGGRPLGRRGHGGRGHPLHGGGPGGPTPLIMFSVKYYDLSCSMAVTASHNPAIYGIKVSPEGDRDADEVVTSDLGGISTPWRRSRTMSPSL